MADKNAVDRAACIFGNPVPPRAYAKACRNKAKFARQFGDDSDKCYHLRVQELPVIGEALGVRNLVLADPDEADAADAQTPDVAFAGAGEQGRTSAGEQGGWVPALDLAADSVQAGGAPVVVGNIRMGFGHYRISMAMASAAHALGYTPYWLDLSGLGDTTCARVIRKQNDLYSLGSRLSQKSRLFNRLYWEPLNSEGFRKLTYNASDQKVAELMAPPLADLPRDVPYIGTHVWPAQAAVHAGLTHVVNAVPDNWPMALHLAEGAIHAVQTPSAYLGYRELMGMMKGQVLRPMPASAIACTGHYVDHELVANIPVDCQARRTRLAGGGPVRYLLSVGGAGAQAQIFRAVVGHLLPAVKRGEAALLVNVGDHRDVWETLVRDIPALSDKSLVSCHFGNFAQTARFAAQALEDVRGGVAGVHAFYDRDIFSAVYSTNLLMRCSDVLVTKPSELSFYPVPKLLIHRIGGHEAWGAIRAAEMGDATYELDTPEEVRSMVDELQAPSHDLVYRMCDAIERNAAAGIYDGAYRVVKMAVAGSIEVE